MIDALGDSLTDVNTLIVHDCDDVLIRRGAFSGVRLVNLLKIDGIANLEIQPYAFDGIVESPRQLIIQNSKLREILSNSFTGISNVDHFWWRNVSVKRVEKVAFAGITHVNYLYFRDATLNHVENGAFGEEMGCF